MSVDASCEAIRRLIQEGQLPTHVYEGDTSSQMRSSLDVIEDTQLAIGAYFASTTLPGSGECYTQVYGILQVLYVQQDAVKHLFEALGRDFAQNGVLTNIRDIRNRAVGHPSKKGRKKLSFHFISRATLTQDSFQLISESAAENDAFEDVDIRALIADQGREIATILAELVASLTE